VLEHTARRHCPGWAIRVEELPAAPVAKRHQRESFVENTHKLAAWQRAVDEAPDGTGVALLDVDTFITRPLDPVWELDFDVAYTVRPDTVTIPFNAGVIFLRATAAARDFMRAWSEENQRLLENPDASPGWRRKYAGVNQGALGHLLARRHAAKVVGLPCLEWNCEDASWKAFDPAVTRIVHVKSHLRNCLFHGTMATPPLKPLMRRWFQLERELVGTEAVG